MSDYTGNQPTQRWEGPPGHMRAVEPSQPGNSRKKLFIIIGIVVLVLLLAGGAYALLSGKQSEDTPQNTANTNQQSQQPEEPATPKATGPQTFKSSQLNMEFTYPEDWTMRENTDKTVITLTSPQTTYQKKDGSSTTGVFTLKLRNGLVPAAMKPNIQNAVAMKDSEIIAYTSPTEQQRQYTNVSFAGNGPNATFFIVTGGVAFKAGEAFGSNIDLEGSVYLFAGGYGADSGDALAFDAVPKATFEGPAYQQALGIIKSLKIY